MGFSGGSSLQASSLEAYLLELHFRKKAGHEITGSDDPDCQYISFYDKTVDLWVYLGQTVIQTGLGPQAEVLKVFGVSWDELVSSLETPEARKAFYAV